MSARQFDSFRAARLFCRQCNRAQSVDERLLLVLPEKELYEYVCSVCQEVVGSREVSAAEQVMRREAAPEVRRGPQVRLL